MKKTTLTGLTLHNFQGVLSQKIQFSQNTVIAGANAAGKTTIFNAYTWLLFGKNSVDRADFNIKTLDKHNRVIPGLEHEVEGTIDIDGVEVVLKRTMKEKHVKIRGTEQTRLDHVYGFFHNGTPIAATEYKAKVSEIISEEFSKVITDPLYFNLRIKWQDRRVILSQIAGDVYDSDVISEVQQKHRSILNEFITSGKALADHKKELTARRLRLKAELEEIPARINEVNRSIPAAQNWEDIESKILGLKDLISRIDEQIENASAAQNQLFEKISDIKTLKFNKEQALQDERRRMSTEHDAKLSQMIRARDSVADELKAQEETTIRNKADIDTFKKEIDYLKEKNDRIRAEWHEENAKTLTVDESSFNCPACDRPLSEDAIADKRSTFLQKFNKAKTERLREIEDEGTRNKSRMEELQSRIDALASSPAINTGEINTRLLDMYAEVEKLKNQLIPSSELAASLVKEIQEIVIPEVQPVDNTELKEEKRKIQDEVDALNADLLAREVIQKGLIRIEELKESERDYSQQIADIERGEIAIDAFNKSKIEMIESRINEKFKMVRFKMFDQQLNGGESEICECMVDGVPFSDLNTAMKINAGLDVINTLTDFYGVSVPIWIDGRESVTELIQTDSQVISLVVDPLKKDLTVDRW